jgi:acyl-coenzyme A thioesterase PaaI-like protein
MFDTASCLKYPATICDTVFYSISLTITENDGGSFNTNFNPAAESKIEGAKAHITKDGNIEVEKEIWHPIK